MAAAIIQSQNLPRFRVIKLGGSLFSMPDLQERIQEWTANNTRRDSSDCLNVWLAGGGAMVDAVRDWQKLHGIDDAHAHQISIDLLSTTARLLHCLFSDWKFVIDIQRLNEIELSKSPNVIFDCSQWAKVHRSLEAGWETTSDSIALRLAIEINARELHLLKSASPASSKLEDAVIDSLVDANFTKHLESSRELCVKISNLRKSFEPVMMEKR